MLREELGETKKEKSELVKRITTLKTGEARKLRDIRGNVKKTGENWKS